jgi:hypothetical protein
MTLSILSLRSHSLRVALSTLTARALATGSVPSPLSIALVGLPELRFRPFRTDLLFAAVGADLEQDDPPIPYASVDAVVLATGAPIYYILTKNVREVIVSPPSLDGHQIVPRAALRPISSSAH